jgi:hypothetical protein
MDLSVNQAGYAGGNRPCGHYHDDDTWRVLVAAYGRRAWRIALIRALIAPEPDPMTPEVLDLRQILAHFYALRQRVPTDIYAQSADKYLEELSALLLLDPCKFSEQSFPLPAGILMPTGR